ncbi:hypothetical protein O5O45_09585 [Hahella aquimaris]|uniref:hypothetical protein n=1 Tax=Hahella sp. HNIBRBA332 TaxID=3015983 RepID=UPI00273C1EEF|nr:hypothetical protein [Hahella sp. HNIBRBA332]WLQ16165.1 hypothetical protein O5O45_09585 [Hahella sp. HNIBRBA332]
MLKKLIAFMSLIAMFSIVAPVNAQSTAATNAVSATTTADEIGVSQSHYYIICIAYTCYKIPIPH